MNKTVSLRGLKGAVRRDYPEDAPIRKVILAEPDEMNIQEYGYKMMVWWKLIPVRREEYGR